jgi:sensor histidine kinase YesM
VAIEARVVAGRLHLSVSGDGPGLNGNGNGIGLVNTRERLRHLYGESHDFNLSSFPGRGVTVRIVIPFREREPEGPDDSDTDY